MATLRPAHVLVVLVPVEFDPVALTSRIRLASRRAGAMLVLLALVGALTWWQAASSEAQSGSDSNLLDVGANTYGNSCAACHGEQGRGIDSAGGSGGPSLVGVGAASVDFYLRTGRMPLTNQNDRVVRRDQQVTDTQVEGLIAYITTFGDGPGIPDVGVSSDLSRGLELFTTNCAACHGPTAAGIAVGQNDVSSALDVATPTQIAEATRIGPGVMPRFSDDALDEEDLADIAAWVVDLRTRERPGGLSLGRSGPVSEGMLAWVIGLGLLGVVMYLLGQKTQDGEEFAAMVDRGLPESKDP